MSITATELKENLSKYLQLSLTEDIFVTKNGKIISKLTNPFRSKAEAAKSLIGSIPNTSSFEDVKDERIKKI